MPSLDTFGDDPERATTTVAVNRKWCRSGLLKNLSWTEVFVLLQILWNQPLRAHRIFGVEERFCRRILSGLHGAGYIEKTEDGYRLVPEYAPRKGDDHGHLWLWPLRWGNISIAARVAFIFIEEQTKGRQWLNRSRLARELGIGRSNLYRQLDVLEDAGLVLPWGARRDKKIVCFNQLPNLKEHVMGTLLTHPSYEHEGGPDEPIAAGSGRDTERVGAGHQEGRSGTRGLSLDSPRTHPHPERREEGAAFGWKQNLASQLTAITPDILRQNGARKVPNSRSIEKSIRSALDRVVLPEKDCDRFGQYVMARLQSSTSFMWKNLHGDLLLAVASALEGVAASGLRLVMQGRQREKDFDSSVQRFTALVESFRAAGCYASSLLAEPERVGGVPRLTWALDREGIPHHFALLDPIAAEAARSLDLVKTPGTLGVEDLRARVLAVCEVR